MLSQSKTVLLSIVKDKIDKFLRQNGQNVMAFINKRARNIYTKYLEHYIPCRLQKIGCTLAKCGLEN